MKQLLMAAGAVVVISLLGVLALPGPSREGITGVWRFDVDLPTGGGNATFGFEQDGESLRGAYRGSYGTADLTGTVRGDHVEFSFETAGLGLITFAGTIEGRGMSGTCDYGTVGVGTWTAARGGGDSLFDN